MTEGQTYRQWKITENPESFIFMMNWFSTKVPMQFSGKGMIFSIIGVGKTGYQHAKTETKTKTKKYQPKNKNQNPNQTKTKERELI